MAPFTADRQSWAGIADLLEILERSRPAWHADAACHEAPFYISWFNDGDGGQLSWLTDEQEADDQAKAICAGCLVREECREWSLAQGPTLSGVWGGMTKADRARARRRGETAPRAVPGEAQPA